jgi:hypothetical protein
MANPDVRVMPAATGWLSEGKLDPSIANNLPIVKARPQILRQGSVDTLEDVQMFVPPGFCYNACERKPNVPGLSRFKCGLVLQKDSHVTIKYGMFPSDFDTKEVYRNAIDELIERCGDITGFTVQEAVAWTPPPGAIESGDDNYRCVVLKLAASQEASEKLAALRQGIMELSPGFDRFGLNPVPHITVAYICSPDNDETATVHMAITLVDELNRRLKGATVQLTEIHLDDNGFPLYGTGTALADMVM